MIGDLFNKIYFKSRSLSDFERFQKNCCILVKLDKIKIIILYLLENL